MEAIMALNLVENVRICEVGMRDGLQNEKAIAFDAAGVPMRNKAGNFIHKDAMDENGQPVLSKSGKPVKAPFVLTVEQKVELLKKLIAAGFKVIEVGSFVHPVKVPQMANTDEVFKAILAEGIPSDVELRALIPNARGVDRAIACGCNKVKLNVSASKGHNLANLNCTPSESVAGFKACVEKAEANGIGISGSISMAFGSPWDYSGLPVDDVKEIVEAYMNVGIKEISLSDASGMAYPTQVYDICTEMKKCYPEVDWWLHFHNTRGLAIANIFAGMQAGFYQFDASFAGVGGCNFIPNATGNVATEDVIHALDQMGVNSGVDLDQCIAIGKRVVEMLQHDTDSYILRAGASKDLRLELPKGQ